MSPVSSLTKSLCLTGAAIVLFAASQTASAAPPASAAPGVEASVQVPVADEYGFDATFEAPYPNLSLVDTPIGTFLQAGWPGAAYSGESGEPRVPVISKLFIAPQGAEISVQAKLGKATTIDLSAEGFDVELAPMQTSMPSPNEYGLTEAYEYDQQAYLQHDASQRVEIMKLGVVRERQLYRIVVSPLAYDPVDGVLTYWSDIDVSVTFDATYAEDEWAPRWQPMGSVLLNPPALEADRGGLNYLILTPPDFAGSVTLTQFAAAKTAAGFNVSTYTVPVGSSPTNIKSYIQSLWGTPDAPDYILIAADTDCTLDTIVNSDSDSIPNFHGYGTRDSGTDLYYACMDGGSDWYPDIAIGRFPAEDLTDLQAMVDKTLFVMAGNFTDPDYLTTASFCAGTDYDCGDRAAHEEVCETYLNPAGITCEMLWTISPYYADTQDMIDAFNDGRLFFVYYGHSHFQEWWEPAFDIDDAYSLSNFGKYPFTFSFTCRTGGFDYTSECLGEALMRGVNKGSVIFLGASRETHYYSGKWIEQYFLEVNLFDTLYDDEIREVGPAWQANMVDFIAEDFQAERERNYAELYNIFGDPSLRIAEENNFSISSDPTSETLCAATTPTAYYSIDVTPVSGFDSRVVLSAANLPAGATAQFSVNNARPPFTSQLSITTDAVGDHTITIHGTASGSAPQFTTINLSVIEDAPTGVVTLTSPAPGITDVSLVPALEWSTHPDATEYEVEIATDSAFNEVVFSAITEDTTAQVVNPLVAGTEYYWHCRAGNACGFGDYTAGATFTTRTTPKYFTEVFSGETFDLEETMIEFAPNGSYYYYEMCAEEQTSLPTDPSGGASLTLLNDGAVYITPSQSVSFYGVSYDGLYVNANGNLTFGAADGAYNETLTIHMNKPRISAVFDDLDLRFSGSASWKETADRVAVTFENVPGYGFAGGVTFQVEIFFDETIRITWISVPSTSCIAGLSEGEGVPGEYEEMDLSAADACGNPCPGDFTQDGLRNLNDLALLLGYYGETGVNEYQGDCNGDGVCNLNDLAFLLGVYKVPCP